MVRLGKPFILRYPDGRDITGGAVKPPPHALEQEFTPGTIRVVLDKWLGYLPGIDEIRQKVVPYGTRLHWPLWFLGDYDQGYSHFDVAPCSINLYYLKQGRKEIVICPTGVTRTIAFERGYDSLFIKNSDGAAL